MKEERERKRREEKKDEGKKKVGGEKNERLEGKSDQLAVEAGAVAGRQLPGTPAGFFERVCAIEFYFSIYFFLYNSISYLHAFPPSYCPVSCMLILVVVLCCCLYTRRWLARLRKLTCKADSQINPYQDQITDQSRETDKSDTGRWADRRQKGYGWQWRTDKERKSSAKGLRGYEALEGCLDRAEVQVAAEIRGV